MKEGRRRTRLPPRLNETSLSGPPAEPWPLALFFDDCRRTTALVRAARPRSSCAALAERHVGESIRSRLSLFDKTRQIFDRTRQHLVWPTQLTASRPWPDGASRRISTRRATGLFAPPQGSPGDGPNFFVPMMVVSSSGREMVKRTMNS